MVSTSPPRSFRCAAAYGAAGTAPAVYNAANEVCVEAFRAGRLRFVDIIPTVAATLTAHGVPSEQQGLQSKFSSAPWRRLEADR